MKRIEKDIVSSNENCYQKDAEMCGPANCKVCTTWCLVLIMISHLFQLNNISTVYEHYNGLP